MKTALKVFLAGSLFIGTAFADGDMGNGGFWAGTQNVPTAEDGDMGNGGKTCPQGQTCLTVEIESSFLVSEFVRAFLSSRF